MADDIRNSNNPNNPSLEAQVSRLVSAVDSLVRSLNTGGTASSSNDRQLIEAMKELIDSSSKPQRSGKSVSIDRRDTMRGFSSRIDVRSIDDINALLKKLNSLHTDTLESIDELNDAIAQTAADVSDASTLSNKQKELAQAESSYRKQQIEKQSDFQKSISDTINSIQNLMTAFKSGTISSDELFEKVSSLQSAIRNTEDTVDAVVSEASSNIRSVQRERERLNDYADTIENTKKSAESLLESAKSFTGQDENSEFEQRQQNLLEELTKQQEEIEKRMVAFTEKMKSATGEELRLIKAQLTQDGKTLDAIKDAKKSVENQTENKQQWADTRKTIKDTFSIQRLGTEIAKGLTQATVFDRLEGVLTSGFDKVYNSVESTRNEISARSRLDSGGFQDLQNSIQDRIEKEELTGLVNQADVNEALVQFSAAGITNTELLETLALRQAELKAEGFSLDLTNEGVMQQLLGLLYSGKTITDIEDVIKAEMGSELSTREEYGNSYALERGGASRNFEETLSQGIAFDWDASQMAKSITIANRESARAGTLGIDPTLFTKTLDALRDRSITDQDTFGKILAKNGLNVETMATMDPADQYKILEDSYKEVFSITNDRNALQELNKQLNVTDTNMDLFKLQQAYLKGNLDISKPADLEGNEKLLEDFKTSAKRGDYESETQKETNKQMNAITEVAIEMEQYYNGDKLYHAVVDPVLGGLKDSTNAIIETLITTSFRGFGQGGGSPTSGGSGAGGAVAGGAAAGGLSQPGSSFMVATGGLMMSASAVSDFVTSDSISEGFDKLSNDSGFWSGAGTVIGTAIAGPLGGIVGGAIVSIAGPAVSKFATKVSDFMVEHSDAAEAMKAIDEREKEQADAITKSSDYLNSAADALRESADTLTKEEENRLKTLDVLSESDAFNDALMNTYSGQDLSKAGNISESELPSDWFEQMLNSGLFDLEAEDKEARPEEVQKMALSYFSAKKLMNQEGMAATEAIQKYVDAEGVTYEQAISKIYGDTISDEQRTNIVNTLETLNMFKEKYNDSQNAFSKKWKNIENSNPGKTTDELISIYTETYGKDIATALQYNGDAIMMRDGVPVLKYRKSDGSETYNPDYYAGKFKSGLTYVPYDGYPAILHEGERILTKEEASSYNNLVSYMIDNVSNSSSSSSDVEQIFTNSIMNGNANVTESISAQTEELGAKIDSITILLGNLIKAMMQSKTYGSDLSQFTLMNSNIMQLNTAI